MRKKYSANEIRTYGIEVIVKPSLGNRICNPGTFYLITGKEVEKIETSSIEKHLYNAEDKNGNVPEVYKLPWFAKYRNQKKLKFDPRVGPKEKDSYN